MSTGFQKQKFYIIGHNPNTVADVKDFLDAGANALEPDICVAPSASGNTTYYVSHDHGASSNPFTPTYSLVTWLKGVRTLLLEKGKDRNLALIMFDFKDPAEAGINDFLAIVHEYFGQFPICSGVAIGVTVGSRDDVAFLNAYDGMYANAAVGIDEDEQPIKVLGAFNAGHQHRYAYANGIILTGIKLGVFASMLDAKGLQATHPDLKLAYTWVVADADAMRDYLRIHLDGMIVNKGTVPQLKAILLEKEFALTVELAQNGYNPWDAPTPPIYCATIDTADVSMAGTDAVIQFMLKGSNGQLVSTLNGNYKDVLEQNTRQSLSFVGGNLGTINSLKLTALTSDGNSDWLPLMIKVTSNKDANVSWFNFGPDDWLKKGHPLTKPAASAPAM